MGRGEGSSWPGWGEGLRGSRLRHASSDAGVLGMHAERQQGLTASVPIALLVEFVTPLAMVCLLAMEVAWRSSATYLPEDEVPLS